MDDFTKNYTADQIRKANIGSDRLFKNNITKTIPELIRASADSSPITEQELMNIFIGIGELPSSPS